MDKVYWLTYFLVFPFLLAKIYSSGTSSLSEFFTSVTALILSAPFVAGRGFAETPCIWWWKFDPRSNQWGNKGIWFRGSLLPKWRASAFISDWGTGLQTKASFFISTSHPGLVFASLFLPLLCSSGEDQLDWVYIFRLIEMIWLLSETSFLCYELHTLLILDLTNLP